MEKKDNGRFLKHYAVQGWVLLLLPVVFCGWWELVALEASSAREAKALFMGSYPLLEYYDWVWGVSASLSAVAFFFGSRLVGGCKKCVVNGVFMLVVAAVTLVLSVLHLLVK